MIDIVNGLFGDVTTLVQKGVILVWLLFVGFTWVKYKTLVQPLGVLIGGGLLVWGVNNYVFVETKVGEDINAMPVPAYVVVVEEPAGV